MFGSFQNDSFASHTHQVGPNTDWRIVMDTINQGGVRGATSTGNVQYIEPNTGATGGSETRPKNLALLPIIKT